MLLHVSFVISSLLHHNHFCFFRFKFGLHIAMHYQGRFSFLLCFHMIINNSSLYMSMLNLILININIMNMKKYMLICLFISTSVDRAISPSVTTSSSDFSFQNLVIWNLFEFSAAEITFKSISLTF